MKIIRVVIDDKHYTSEWGFVAPGLFAVGSPKCYTGLFGLSSEHVPEGAKYALYFTDDSWELARSVHSALRQLEWGKRA